MPRLRRPLQACPWEGLRVLNDNRREKVARNVVDAAGSAYRRNQ